MLRGLDIFGEFSNKKKMDIYVNDVRDSGSGTYGKRRDFVSNAFNQSQLIELLTFTYLMLILSVDRS
jgi:hypothetical protein